MLPWVEHLFGPERRLAYRMSFKGNEFAQQWTLAPTEIAPGLFQFDMALELDPSVLGTGGSLFRGRARLQATANFEPVRYLSQAGGAQIAIDFDGDSIRIKLPDGSEKTVPRGEARYLNEANYIGLDALMLAHADSVGALQAETELRFFLVNSLVTLPYKLDEVDAVDAGRRFKSSLSEDVVIGDGGILISSDNHTAGVLVERITPPTELPEWEHPTAPERATYSVPANASFELVDVTIPGPKVEIGAAVTIPAGDGPYPAAVFLAGSGTHDRHGVVGELDLGTHEIVDHLSERGVLGVRYDTRGAGTTAIGGDVLEAGMESIIDDARAVIEWTLARPDVDTDKVFLIGHSQGGTVALALVSRGDVAPAGVVLLATPGRSMEELSAEQTATSADMHGFDADQRAEQIRRNAELFELVRSGVPWTEENIPAVHLAAAPVIPWLREYLKFNPVELVGSISAPLLLLYGSTDFQVKPDADGEPLAKAARSAGADVTFEVLDGLDHLFKAAPEGSTLASYHDRDRRVDPAFLDRLAGWIGEKASAVNGK